MCVCVCVCVYVCVTIYYQCVNSYILLKHLEAALWIPEIKSPVETFVYFVYPLKHGQYGCRYGQIHNN